MPSYFVMQPNGKLAVFSTIVDHFTHLNLTEDESVQWCRDHRMSEMDAAAKVRRGTDDDLKDIMNRPCCDDVPLRRWHDALNMILHMHGTDGLAKFLIENPETYADDPSSQ
jgi:hypothetical protein